MAQRLTFMQRIVWAYQAAVRSLRATSRPVPSRVRKPALATFPLDEPTAQWRLTDFDTYAEEGYGQNSVVFSAIWFKSRAIASIPISAVHGDVENPEPVADNHPLALLLRHPNRHQSIAEFMMQSHTYFNLDGNVFIPIVRDTRGTPRALYSLRPDHVDILIGKQGLMGYRWRPYRGNDDDVVYILPEDMMHIKMPNPLDPYEGMGYGLSPIMALARSADVDNNITEFLKMFFETGAVIMGVLETDQTLSPQDISEIQERWKERYGGFENWSEKIGVLARGMKYTRVSPTFSEMAFDTLDERNESRILSVLGVPPILVGARTGLTHSTYSNYEQARLAAWEDTLIPEANLYESEFETSLIVKGAWPQFDIYNVPAIQQRTLQRIQGFKILFDAGYPRDMAAAIAGVPAGESPNGDVSYMPLNLMPSGRLSAQPLPQAPSAPNDDTDDDDDTNDTDDDGNDDEPTDEGVGQTDAGSGPHKLRSAEPQYVSPWSAEQLQVLWKTADRTAVSWEPAYRAAAANVFERGSRNLQRMWQDLTNNPDAAVEFMSSANFYLMTVDEQDWRDMALQLYGEMFVDAYDTWASNGLSTIGDSSQLAVESIGEYPLQFAQTITDTTRENIRHLLEQSIDEGWTHRQTQQQISHMFGVWATGQSPDVGFLLERIPAYRAEIIARTETMRSYNIASVGIFYAAGVPAKMWLATMDDRVRPDHEAANGQIVGIRANFDVGGYMMSYPGDMGHGAPIEEVAMCRCTTVPVFGGGA